MKNSFRVIATLLFLALFAVKSTAMAAVYEIDPEHSSVTFKIRHLVSKTQGQFRKFNGTITYDEKNLKASKVDATIEVKSLDTGVTKRDEHLLRDEDFFDAKKYPEMKFATSKIAKVDSDGKKAELLGKLTLHGVTKPVLLNVEMVGKGINPFTKKPVVGFKGTTTIDRRQWGVTWNDNQGGNLMLGEEVEIALEIEADAK